MDLLCADCLMVDDNHARFAVGRTAPMPVERAVTIAYGTALCRQHALARMVVNV